MLFHDGRHMHRVIPAEVTPAITLGAAPPFSLGVLARLVYVQLLLEAARLLEAMLEDDIATPSGREIAIIGRGEHFLSPIHIDNHGPLHSETGAGGGGKHELVHGNLQRKRTGEFDSYIIPCILYMSIVYDSNKKWLLEPFL